MKENVVVKTSDIHGKGVFANKDFENGDTILKIDDSHIITEESKLSGKERNWLDFLEHGKKILMKEPERYINHSCEPNTYVKTIQGIRNVIAMKGIHKGEEITYDYAINGYGEGKWSCNCNSKNCRKVCFSDYFRLPLYLQKKYRIYLDKWFRQQYQTKVSKLIPEKSDRVFGRILPGRSYKRRSGVYGIICNKGGRLAIIRRKQNAKHWFTYHLPGGGLERNETHEVCLKREVREELGWDIEILDFVGKAHRYFYVPHQREYYQGIGYFYKAKKVKQLNSVTEKGLALVWLTPSAAIPKMLDEHHAWAIKEALVSDVE